MIENPPLVSICCITYNHAPYIRQCLDGFIMQKTAFPVEILVHDDASTDGTPDIIREYEARYPDTFKPIYQTENQYSKGISFVSKYNFERARGKYIAMCEGDDYWTDPLKLQKQVDFLEGHPDYTICGGRYMVLESDQPELREQDWMIRGMAKYPEGRTVTLNNVYDEYLLWLLTVCFRKDCLKGIERFNRFKDDVLYAVTLERGKGFVFPDVFGVYRLHQGGVWTGKTLEQRLRENEVYLNELFPHFGNKSKSLRKKYFRDIIGLRFLELTESNYLFKDYRKMIKFALSGKIDTVPYQIAYFFKLTRKYFTAYLKKRSSRHNSAI